MYLTFPSTETNPSLFNPSFCGKSGRPVSEKLLQDYFAAHWEPSDCAQYMTVHHQFQDSYMPNNRRVVLDVAAIEKRFALCLWRECMKLATRRMTPEARKLVHDMQLRMESKAGIEVVGRGG